MQEIDRRQLGKAIAYATPTLFGPTKPEQRIVKDHAPFVIANDGTRLFVQDWGRGRPVVFLSAWTLQSNVWGSYIAALTASGFRCVAPDRRAMAVPRLPIAGTI